MPNARSAIAPRARPPCRSSACAGRPIIAAGPGAGPTTSPAWWKRRLSTPPGWNACRTAFRTARPRRPYERSAIWTSPNFRRSSRRAASAGTDRLPFTRTHVMHRDLPRPSLRATPKALRYGRGSLLCMTWISSRQPPMRGHDWTRKGGRNWKRFDSLLARTQNRPFASIEDALLIRELMQGLGLSQHDLARRCGRDVSWISRRLQLLSGLPDAALTAVRDGTLSSWSANRVVVPLARANAEHADRLLTALADAPLSTRELHCWFEHYQKAFRSAREHMVSHPRLFLDALRETGEQRAGLRLRAGPEGECAADLRSIEAVLARLRKR